MDQDGVNVSEESNNNTGLPASNMEPHFGNASLGAQEIEGLDTPVTIRVISYRKRIHDPDGVSFKAVLDGIVRLGLLPDDSSEYVQSVTFESRKAKEEKTVIEIDSV